MSAPGPAGAPRGPAGSLRVAALLAACAVGGFWLYRLSAPTRGPVLYPDSLSGPARPAPEGPAVAPAPAPAGRRVPAEVPAIRLPALDGTPRSLADFRGKLLVINFWATWCDPCRREIPLLQALRRERAKDGVEIVGIAIDHRDEVARYAAARGMTYPILVGEAGGLEAVSAFGMDTVLPFSVFADRSGRVITLKVGELHADEAGLILDRMSDLDQGRLSLTAAREAIARGMSRLNELRAAQGPAAKN